MTERIPFQEVPKGVFDNMIRTELYLAKTGIDHKLAKLIKYRVSQINGCAYCLDMHHKEAIHIGETELRLHSLAAWRDAPYYTPQERAALAFAEALTNLNYKEVDDKIIDTMTDHFSKADIANLTLLVTQINAWNRLNKVLGTTPGNYKVGMFEQKAEAVS